MIRSAQGGAVDFVSTVNDTSSDAHTLAVSGSSVTFGAAVGNTELASLNVTGPTTLDGSVTTGGVQTYNSPTSLGNNVTFTAASGDITFDGAVNAGSYNLTLVGNGVSFGGNVSGTGTLTIEPYTASATIGVDATNGSTLLLTPTDLGYIQSGFADITIGSARIPAQ